MRNNNFEVKKKGWPMAFRAVARWSLFALFVMALITLPLALLWDVPGLVAGLLLGVSCLWWIGFRGTERVLRRLGAHKVAPAEVPPLDSLVPEYCRRLGIPSPHIAIIENPAINLAVLGFSHQNAYLILTRGALEGLPREELSALVGLELCHLWHGEIFCESWLSQFLAVVDRLIAPVGMRYSRLQRRSYAARLFFRQILIYPLSLFPITLLRGLGWQRDLHVKAAKVTRNPVALSQALRRCEAARERFAFHVPFSGRHLFLLPPPTQDPLARVFFEAEPMVRRIRDLERMTVTAGAT